MSIGRKAPILTYSICTSRPVSGDPRSNVTHQVIWRHKSRIPSYYVALFMWSYVWPFW